MNQVAERTIGIGHNIPDYAIEATERMKREHGGFEQAFEQLAAEAAVIPEEIDDDETALSAGGFIKRSRDLDSRIELIRVNEKEPHLRAGNAIDSFFNAIRDRIGKRNKNDRSAKPGLVDILQGRINAHQARKESAVRAERERVWQEEQRIARAAAEEAERKRIEAEEAERRAAAARKPEIREEKGQAAAVALAAATQANVAADTAREAALDARLGTMAKSADLVRTRGQDGTGSGVLLTTAKENYAFMIEREKLNFAMLAPYFTDAEVEKALRSWAKATSYRIQMEGAEIGTRNKGVTR